MRNIIKQRLLYLISFFSAIVMICVTQPAFAITGPEANPLAQVVISNDTDSGDGEQWGRPGGREITFSIIDISQFTLLLWGAVDEDAVGIAFDGELNPAERLTYTSNPTTGQAVWTGQTQVEIATGVSSTAWFDVDTKFILSVEDSVGNPVAFTFDSVTGLPRVDVTGLIPSIFTARLEMLAKNPSSEYTECDGGETPIPEGQFGPALDVFDCLMTLPTADEHAITEFNGGFFYDSAGEILDLEEHDAHITGLIDVMEAKADDLSLKVGFLHEDWPNVWSEVFDFQGVMLGEISNLNGIISGYDSVFSALEAKADNLNGLVSGFDAAFGALEAKADSIPQRFDELSNQLNELPFHERFNRLDQLPDTSLFLLLFGFPPEIIGNPEMPPFDFVRDNSMLYQVLDALEAKADALETKADDLAEQIASLQASTGEATEIDIQVKDFKSLELKGKETETIKRFVILLKVNGVPKEGGIITSVDAIVDGGEISVVPVVEFTATELGGGIYAAEIPITDSIGGAKVLFMQVSYTENSDTIYGSTLLTIGPHTE
jgi:hypothetical protein